MTLEHPVKVQDRLMPGGLYHNLVEVWGAWWGKSWRVSSAMQGLVGGATYCKEEREFSYPSGCRSGL